MLLDGTVRAVAETIGKGIRSLTLGLYGEVVASQLLPPYAKLVASGQVFILEALSSTGKAPVQAAPVASPEWGVYNANPDGGKSLVLIQAGVMLNSGTSALGIGIFVASAIGPQTVVTTDYSTGAAAIKTCADGTPKKPAAFLINNPTLLGDTPAYTTLVGSFDTTTASTAGSSIVGWVDGLIVAPPKGILCLEVGAPAGSTALFAPFFVVAEVQL
ncbi:hypothetical protein LCGC14_1507720 [marine sediment metagenome]|uniref:Uncharacterized protein n=1 Tax=marine sediment metagenome TaxID=412755 RepID=A0A0F9LHR4_9ZZZZ